MSQHRLTKRQKRILRQNQVIYKGQIEATFNLKHITPLTQAQKDVFEAYDKGYHLMLHGVAGTGKTFIGIYLALSSVLESGKYGKLYIVRSVVPSRDMGFLPGNHKEKSQVYEVPYADICARLFDRGNTYDLLKTKNIIEFMTTSFVRGITLDNCVLIVDEVQNMSPMELHSLMTRVGENCRVIFSGDVNQDDLTSERKKEYSGLRNFMKIIETMDEFNFIEFNVDDIVRSDLVKSYIIARNKLGMD